MFKKFLLLLLITTLVTSCVEENESKIKENIKVKIETKIETKIEKEVGTEIITENKDEKILNEKDIVSISMEDVKLHNSSTNCYTTINSKVYDITSFFGKHPGGDDKLEKICGKDGTKMFSGQHGNNDDAKAKLESMYKGELQK